MLMPKRVKRRRVHRGRMTGKCTKGNKIAYGDYGLVAMEPGWIKSNQIEAARVAMTRFIKRGGKVWIDIFPHKPVTKKPADSLFHSPSERYTLFKLSSDTFSNELCVCVSLFNF